MKITLPYQVVLVCKGQNSQTPATVLAHEIPVLEHLHTDVRLTDVEPPVKEAVFRIDENVEGDEPTLAEEYARLEMFYRGSVEKPEPVKASLGTVKDFVNSFEPADTSEKDELLERAKALGIKATSKWGIQKIKDALAEVEG